MDPSPLEASKRQLNQELEGMTKLVCVPDAISLELRPAHVARVKRLFGEAALERQAVTDGYEFVFRASELEEVARFVALERECCTFLSFTIEVTDGDDRVRLRVHGPPGSREVIEAEILDRGSD